MKKEIIQPKEKITQWVINIDGFKTIMGYRLTYDNEKIREEVSSMEGNFILPSKYTFKLVKSVSFGYVAKIKLVSIPTKEATRERFLVESEIDHAGIFFGEIHKKYTSQNKLVEMQQYKNSDSQLSYLWVDDKIVAFVIEARSAFNHVEVVKGEVEN